jgi:glycosyltransferase involved in cell wall biosynthesis
MMSETILTDNIDLSVVIPIYNERENLVPLEKELQDHLGNLNIDYEILFIDDGSQDGSAQLIKELQSRNPRIRLIQFKKYAGQSDAFAAGFKLAKGRIIVTMDADLQNNPEDISLLIDSIGDYDVVCGWRHKRNDPWIRKISSKIANNVRNCISEESIADNGCSLKAFRRECFDGLKLYKGMHRFFPTLMKMRGFRVTEVKVGHRPRLHGQSKYNIRNRRASSFLDLLVIRWMKKRQLTYELIKED